MTAARKWLTQRRKAVAALAGVVLGWGPVAQATHFAAAAWWALAAGVAGVFGVHAVKNDEEPTPWEPAAKMVDGGQSQVVSLVAIVVLLLIVLRVFRLI